MKRCDKLSLVLIGIFVVMFGGAFLILYYLEKLATMPAQ